MREHNVWWHWQNLNERKSGGRKGSGFWHGRAWLYLWSWVVHWEWRLWSRACHLGVDLGGNVGGDELLLKFAAALPPISLYFGVEAPCSSWLWNLMPERTRECRIAVHHWAIWINPFSREHEWIAKDPWWVRGLTIHIDDIIWGKQKCTRSEPKYPQRIAIELDGRQYHGTASFEHRVWKRPRWFAKHRDDTWIDMDEGLPHAGKGDCGYDCGDDALCGWGVDGHDVEKAIASGIEKVLKYRKRYGNASTVST